MANREKHRTAAQIKRAGQNRRIKTDMIPGTSKMTEAYKTARREAKRLEKVKPDVE